MTKRIRFSGSKEPVLRSKTAEPPVDQERVAKALGSRRLGKVPVTATPTLLALREQLAADLASTGGRPGLRGADVRQRVPMSAADWKLLEAVASSVATDGFTPTPGQVASQLLRRAIATLLSSPTQIGRAEEPVTKYQPTSSVERIRRQVRESQRSHLMRAQAHSEKKAA